jgi:hypothetical protein
MRLLVLLAGLAAAWLLPGGPPGIGFPLVAAFMVAAVAMSRRPTIESASLLGLALGLAAMAAVLDARWVVVVDITAAWLLASVAVAGRSVAAPVATLTGVRSAPALAPPFTRRSATALRGAVFGSVLVLPFAALFWTADAVFAQLGRDVLVPAPTLPARLAVFAVVVFVALGLALARRGTRRLALDLRRRFEPAEWCVALVLLNLLFLAFVGVQVTVLFGGRDHVLRTAGLTYAEYARQGFWQLLVVACLTIGVVALAMRTAATHTPRHMLALRALLSSLCGLAIVVVASALHRLSAYEDAFGLTRPRLAAETVAWAFAALFCLVVLALAVDAVRRRLGAIVLYGAAIGLLAFSLSSPDARIAARNVERWEETGLIDVDYARSLSADAVPALSHLPSLLRAQALSRLEARLARDEPVGSFNLSRDRARPLLAR